MSTSLEIERVAVVGAGFMGSGIAEAAAVSGVPVVLRDVDENSLEAARGRIEGSLARAVKGGKLGPADADLVRGRITLTNELGNRCGPPNASWDCTSSRRCR
jgi:3-hydroxybutyryl-CoA dehydrogenase